MVTLVMTMPDQAIQQLILANLPSGTSYAHRCAVSMAPN